MEYFTIDKGTLDRERSKKGWSIETLAKKAGTSASQIYKCCDAHCGVDTIQNIAKALDQAPWYRILTQEGQEKFEIPEPPTSSTNPPLWLSHRTTKMNDEYYDKAFATGVRVLYVTIMSVRSLKSVTENLTPNTSVDVLTWKPETADEIRGWAQHEAKDADAKIKQTEDALIAWDEIAANHPNIRVFTYGSVPTMQGTIVENLWALIELLPFDTIPEMRPGLLFRSSVPTEAEAFWFFSERFQALLRSAKPRVPGEVPRWSPTLFPSPTHGPNVSSEQSIRMP